MGVSTLPDQAARRRERMALRNAAAIERYQDMGLITAGGGTAPVIELDHNPYRRREGTITLQSRIALSAQVIAWLWDMADTRGLTLADMAALILTQEFGKDNI